MRHEPSIPVSGPVSGNAERAPGRSGAASEPVHAIDRAAAGQAVRKRGLTAAVPRGVQVARSWPLWRRLALGGVIAAAAVTLRQFIDEPLTDQHLYATLLPAVAMAAVLGRRAAGLLVVGVAAALTHVFIAPLALVTDWLTLAAFVIGSLVIVAAAGVLHAALDELEERKAADASTAAQSQLAAIVESTSDAVIGFDNTGRIFSWNPAAERLFGYTADEAIGRNADLLVAPLGQIPSGETARGAFDLALGGERFASDTRRVAKDGTVIDVALTATQIRDREGRVLGVSAIMRDIRERRRSELALRQSEDRLQRFVTDAPAAIAMLDRGMNYIAASRRWVDAYGLDPANFIGRFHYELHPDLPPHYKDVHKRALAGEVVRAEEEFLPLRDGTLRWVRWEVRPWHEANGNVGGIVILSDDVTARVEMVRDLRESRQNLARAQSIGRIGSWRLDVTRNALDWSEENHRIFGVRPGKPMSYDGFLAIVHPDDRAFVDEAWKRALAGEAYDIEHRIVVDGAIRWVRERAELEFGPQGRLLGGFGTTQDITEKKEAEARLAEREAQLRFALSGARAAAWRWNIRTGEQQWSPEGYVLHGRDPALGSPSYADWMSCLHPDDRVPLEDVLARAAKQSDPSFRSEYRVVLPSGEVRWLASLGRIEFGADGAAISMSGINLDVTERRRTQEALALAKQQLEAHIDNSPLAVIEFDREFRVVRWSAGAERLFGWSAAEVCGKLVTDLRWVHEADSVAVTDIMERMKTGDSFRNVTVNRNYRKDGSIADCQWYNSAVYDAQGNLASILSSVLDVTERNRAERELRKSEERLRMSTEAGGIGTFTVDVPSGNAEFSPETSVMVGFPAMSGAPISEVFARVHRDDLAMVRQHYEAALDPLRGGHLRVELRFVQPGGAVRWMTWSGRVEFTDEDNARRPLRLLGICADTTERRQVLEELRLAKEDLERRVAERTAELQDAMQRRQEAQEALAHSQRLEALGRLAGGLTHDFNNTLAAIGAHIELAAARTPDELARDYLGKALDAVASSAGLNLRLLSFTRRKALPREVVDTRQVLANSVEMVRRTIDGGITLTADIDDDLWPTIVDVSEVQSAMLNLAINACDAMRDGGTLSIRVENAVVGASPDDAQLEGNSASGGQFVRVVVADDGEGMSPEVLARAGEPFFTTKSVSKGTGLGLNSVREFVRAIGGFMTIRSQLGKGTVVAIYLPSAVGQQPQHHLPADRSIVSLGDGETVLLVEDDERVLEATHALIEGLGYAVIDARSGEEALRLLASDAHVAVVLSDVVMPGQISGYDVARTVKRDHPNVGMVLASGYDAEEQRGSEAVPGVRSLRKPFTRAAVAEVLRKAMAPG